MKNHFIMTMLLSFIMLFLPFLSLNDSLFTGNRNYEAETKLNTETVKVENSETNKVTETDLFDYIVGCVAAEMPASFETEALKAQAVASYTYKKYLTENGNDTVSDNSEIHQAYKTKEELKEIWGDKYDFYIKKIEDAVRSVFGEYLSKEGKTIPALYHALSPGMTESAETVFGKDISTLRSTTAPGDRLSPDYISEKIFTKNEMEALLKQENLTTTESPEKWLRIAEKNDSKFVAYIVISGKEYSGNEARKLFGLNSPYFSTEYADEKFIFTVYGKGHGVGMSQYSADYMARQGSTYKEILMHFYEGCDIIK